MHPMYLIPFAPHTLCTSCTSYLIYPMYLIVYAPHVPGTVVKRSKIRDFFAPHPSLPPYYVVFEWSLSGFEYRNPSKIRCPEIGQIWLQTLIVIMKSWHFLKWHPDLSYFPTSDFRRVPILKTTYTIMKTCSEVSI